MEIKISLIIPCYNEEINIQKGVLDKIGNYTKNNSHFLEVLIADDGSNDNTKKIIKDRYLQLFPKIKLLENNHLGKAQAIIAGIKKAQGNYVMFSDIDLATPIEEADKLIKEVKNDYQIVIGSRSSSRKGAPLLRKVMAVGFMSIRNFIFGLKNIKDTQCGFKIFAKKEALEIISRLLLFKNKKTIQGSSVSAAFDLEFLFLANKLKFRIKEVSVIWKHVETKNVNFIKDTLETLKDMATMKYYDLMGRYHV